MWKRIYTNGFPIKQIKIKRLANIKNNQNVSRPSWRKAELDAAKQYPNYSEQKSFLNGKEVPYGTKGSVRPDLYHHTKSIDVKNYNIQTSTGRSNIVRNIKKQYYQRIVHLPPGTKQTVLIDIRGQKVLQNDLMNFYNSILKNTNNGITVIFKTR